VRIENGENMLELLRFFKKVMLKDVMEAEKYGEKYMSFELYDILEEASPRELDSKIEENIEYVLKREGLFSPDMEVIVPMGALRWECEEYSCSYVADFEVFKNDEIVAYGTASGFMHPSNGNFVIIDMTVTIPTKDVKRLLMRRKR